ncbi:MAG TPA: helix-turn-helix domain-containing protein [Candidatus Didemnitutus sp.]|nr:helix-turn-helix domain-containing protein [Candidatus Didemnitutus sp.]
MTEARQSIATQFLGGDSLLLIPEAARLLRMSDKTVRRMITDGKLASKKLRGKRVIKMSDLNALVQSSS